MSGFPFFLKANKDTSKKSPIFLNKSFSGVKFKFGIGMSCFSDLWDKENQRPISKKYRTEDGRGYKALIKDYEVKHPFIKTELENISIRLNKTITAINSFVGSTDIQNKVLDLSELRSYLNSEVKGVKETKKGDSLKGIYLVDYVEQFVKEITNGERLIRYGKRKGQRYSYGTIKNYKGFLAQLKAYESAENTRLRWSSITLKFYDSFIKFFNAKSYSKNTTGKHIKNLKVVLDQARSEGLHNNLIYQEREFETLTAPTTEVFLNETELKRLFEYDLSDNKRLEIIRDVFLIGCYTALRFSDIKRIVPKHINNNRLTLITQKTGGRVVIPIRPELKLILDKYNNTVPRVYEQKVNKEIKGICESIGITEVIEVRKMKGGKEMIVNVPKHNLIKTHTGRRTGATLLYLAKVPTIDIMKITGHTTEANLLKYIRATPEETADRLASSSFFLGNTLKVKH